VGGKFPPNFFLIKTKLKGKKVMSLTIKSTSDDFEQVPTGTHAAICNSVIDLGIQSGPYGEKHQVVLRFETPLEKLTKGEHAGEPFVISTFYTASLSPRANLRRDLESWRGRAFTAAELDAFDLGNVLGKPCTISVGENENGRHIVTGVSAPMKGVDMPAQYNDSLRFELDSDSHGIGSQAWQNVPEWLKKIIEGRVDPDAEEQLNQENQANDSQQFVDDDIPW
jgi:hypothetical protein